MNGLELMTAPRGSIFERVLGKNKKEAAIVAIHNTLASVPLRELTSQSLLEPLDGIDAEQAWLRPRLVNIYEQALRRFVGDGRLETHEIVTLSEMRSLLRLEDHDVERANVEFIYSSYERACAAAFHDGHLSPAERERLDRIVADLSIPESVRAKIFERFSGALVQSRFAEATADFRFTPEEEAEIFALARDLDVTPKFDARTSELLEAMRTLARIASGELPVIDVPVNLKRGETCAAVAEASVLKIKTVTLGYVGGSVGISKTIYGVRFRTGYSRSRAIKEEQLTVVDSGTLYITTTRVLFVGEKKTTQIPLTKILSAMFYEDGFEIQKETGLPVMIRIDGEASTEMIRAVFDGAMLGALA